MGSRDYLKLGDYNAICDECGFKYKASELRERWDGFMVCKTCWEPRHPQDFVRAVKEDVTVPFSRPDGTATYITGVSQASEGDNSYTSANLGQDNRLNIVVPEGYDAAVNINLDNSFTAAHVVVINIMYNPVTVTVTLDNGYLASTTIINSGTLSLVNNSTVTPTTITL